jgi:hypothetical protein
VSSNRLGDAGGSQEEVTWFVLVLNRPPRC